MQNVRSYIGERLREERQVKRTRVESFIGLVIISIIWMFVL